MKKEGIIGKFIKTEELVKMGFDVNIFNYVVEVSVKDSKGELILQNCKVIDLQDGSEPFYFTQGDDSIFVFTALDNPNMKIKKVLLN